MRSLPRTVLCCAALAIGFLGASVSTFAGFGNAVLVGDGEIFVGEAANQFRPGTVYVYRRGGSGSWQVSATLTAPGAVVGDQFGSALALDGTRLFVASGTTAVHVFNKTESIWTAGGSIAASAVPGQDIRLGRGLAASGEWLFVGRETVGAGRGRGAGGGGGGGGGRGGAEAGPAPAGAVYVFKRDAAGTYAHHSTLVSGDSASAGDNFGASLAINGTVLLIGASGQANRAGVVHEFG
ncbi:MAG TPA: hypothetical protein VF424_04735, partial [Vicinamibacterales bacterium]